MFARQSRRFPTQSRAPGRFSGPKFGAHAGRPVLIYVNWSIGRHTPFTRNYFTIKLERRLIFGTSNVFFTLMKPKVSRSDLSQGHL